jgi:NADP-dependent 3-hydroxy acid dehydrogenase YdfG
MTSSSPKAILFIGASTGVGLSTLRRSLAAGHTCIALARKPERLTENLGSAPSNLRIVQGDGKSLADLKRCLTHPSQPKTLVDFVCSTVGSTWNMKKMTIDDPTLCGDAMKTLMRAVAELRGEGYSGNPHVVGVSSTGLSTLGRDVPLLQAAFYYTLLKGPHEDKRVMENELFNSTVRWTVVRCSLLTDGGESTKRIRAGMEDPNAGKVESRELGYTISREDSGKWIFENLVQGDGTWVNKVATITY